MKQSAKIENWYVIHDVLFGTVYDHPKIEDGTEVQTSGYAVFSKAGFAETRNTIYKLGKKLDGIRNESPEVKL